MLYFAINKKQINIPPLYKLKHHIKYWHSKMVTLSNITPYSLTFYNEQICDIAAVGTNKKI